MTSAELLETNDAMVWAKEFVAIKKYMKWTIDEIDEGLMAAWFSNAMAAQEFKDRQRRHKGSSCSCEEYIKAEG